MALDLKKIIQYPLKDNQYLKEASEKRQIVIHHTAGNSNPFLVVDGWNSNTEQVATALVIGGKPYKSLSWKDGDVIQCYGSQFWAYHLGLKQSNNVLISKQSIGIEICNWGYLTKDELGNYKTYVGSAVPPDEVIELEQPFRGYKYYHRYTDAQLASLRDLLIFLCDKYHIPKTYNEDMWLLNSKAMNGVSGIWTHDSYRTDKTDCSPQPKLIGMLQSLSL